MSDTGSGCCGGGGGGGRSGAGKPETLAEVCALPPAELAERLAMIRADFAPHVRERARLDDGRAWAFPAAMRSELERLVALERECCSGLTWSVREDAASVWLQVRGPGAAALPDLGDAAPAPGDR